SRQANRRNSHFLPFLDLAPLSSGLFEWIAASPPGAIDQCKLAPCHGAFLLPFPVTSKRGGAHIAGDSSRSSATSLRNICDLWHPTRSLKNSLRRNTAGVAT